MEHGLDRLPWYGQIATFLMVALVGVLVFHVYWVAPTRDEMVRRGLEVNRKRIEVAQAQQTAGRLADMRTEVEAAQVRLDDLSAVLAGERDAASLLRRLQSLAANANLTIRAFTAQAALIRKFHSEWPSRLELHGTYHNLGRFFDRVSKFSQVINISDVAIRAIDPPQPDATVNAECTATTFALDEIPADAEEDDSGI